MTLIHDEVLPERRADTRSTLLETPLTEVERDGLHDSEACSSAVTCDSGSPVTIILGLLSMRRWTRPGIAGVHAYEHHDNQEHGQSQ